MISKLTEEKTSALQQSQKLHRELVLFMICIVGICHSTFVLFLVNIMPIILSIIELGCQ